MRSGFMIGCLVFLLATLAIRDGLLPLNPIMLAVALCLYLLGIGISLLVLRSRIMFAVVPPSGSAALRAPPWTGLRTVLLTPMVGLLLWSMRLLYGTALAIGLLVFLLAALVIRDGLLPLSPIALMAAIYLLGIGMSLVILRSRIVFAVVPPSGSAALRAPPWTWRRTILLTPTVGLLLWAMPLLYGTAFGSVSLHPLETGALVQALLIQIMLVGLAEELLFREAALSDWVERPITGLGISTVAFAAFHFHPHLDPALALVAAGTGLLYGSLRLAGSSILAIALLHGVTSVVFSRAVSLGLSREEFLIYAICFLFFTSCISAALLFWRYRMARLPEPAGGHPEDADNSDMTRRPDEIQRAIYDLSNWLSRKGDARSPPGMSPAEYHSRRWHFVCPTCGNRKSFHDAEDVRWLAYSKGEVVLGRCSNCDARRLLKVDYIEPDGSGPSEAEAPSPGIAPRA